jgi:hypothetical protein
MAIVKSTGVTPTEKVLADLCERSFLKLWSYPNPIKEDQNELCDLLAVFDNHVFIFFDRESRQFDASDKDPLLTWQRWKRRVIDAQVRSAHGAERYLRSGRGIFLDRERTVPFPITFDKETATIHKIIIAHGAQEACAAFSPDNVYGSLGISYGAAKLTSAFPFMVNLDSSDPVHIFDSHNLPIILGELDTFFDFCSYLDAKLNAIRSLDGLCYCGEEDLLAHYWTNFDEMKNQHFIGTKEKDINLVMIGEGEWKDFSELEIYRRKKIDDKISYLWDELIQRTCQNALDGTLLGNANLLRGESAIHEMAREPRFSRRGLAAHMMRAIENFPETHKPIVRHVSFMPSFYREKAYVFLQLRGANCRL